MPKCSDRIRRRIWAWPALGLIGFHVLVALTARSEGHDKSLTVREAGTPYAGATGFDFARKPDGTSQQPPLSYRPRYPGPALLTQSTLDAVDAAISSYELLASSGGWPRIPRGVALRLGSNDLPVLKLRERLQRTGDLAEERAGDPRVFNSNVEAAVVRFQRRHGLYATGVVNQTTLDRMNVPATERLKLLRINRDRLAKLIKQPRLNRYVVVNISAYELQAVANGNVEFRSRTIVGKPATPTPIFRATIRALNFVPFWHVPHSVVLSDIILGIARDPAYLKRIHMRVYKNWVEVDAKLITPETPRLQRYLFRQDPGPLNALGVLRLDMPNRHGVYMHDTPFKRKFHLSRRAISAGCVRVQNILTLADWLSRGTDGWTPGKANTIAARGQRYTAKPQKPVPVWFVYLTAWVASNGSAQFREDIYQRDNTDHLTANNNGLAETATKRFD